MPLCLLVIGKHLHGDKEARQTHPATSNNVVLLGHVTEWRKMIENARLKASASSLLPAYASKQNQTLHLVPHPWKTPANQDTHMGPVWMIQGKLPQNKCFMPTIYL